VATHWIATHVLHPRKQKVQGRIDDKLV